MSILGTWIDKVGGNTLAGVTTTTYNHSLATTPDLTLVNVRSLAAASANSAIIAIGANASLSTVNVAVASAGSASQVAQFDVWNYYYWYPIR